MPDLTEQIERVANEPSAATVAGQSATNQPIPDLIEAAKFLAGQTAATGTNPSGGPVSGWAMLRPARARTEGTG